MPTPDAFPDPEPVQPQTSTGSETREGRPAAHPGTRRLPPPPPAPVDRPRRRTRLVGSTTDAEAGEVVAEPPTDAGTTAVSDVHDHPTEPVRFGKFLLISELSRTPNGVVYQARQADLPHRVVALKVLGEGDDPLDDRPGRFRREVESVAKLRHPHIVPVYEVGQEGEWTWFSMAFIDGESLAERLRREPLPGREAARILQKVAGAIHYAHTHGIIHRDIKPSNILLDEHGEPLIADFGLAKDVEADITLTRSGVTMGTPPYMAPEQARGLSDQLDSRTDVYGLGATLYEAVTGRTPYSGETAMQTLMRVLEKPVVKPRRVTPSLSPDLEAIILRCLARHQDDRYANAELLAEDLGRFLAGDWVHAREPNLVSRVSRRVVRSRSLVAAAGLLVVAAGLLAISLSLSQLNPERKVQSHPKQSILDDFDRLDWDAFHRPHPDLASFAGPSAETNAAFEILHTELWMAPPLGWESRVVFKEPLGPNDFRFTCTVDFVPETGALLGAEDVSLLSVRNFNFGIFVAPDIPPVPDRVVPGESLIPRGYWLELGADRNTRTVLWRDTREVWSQAGRLHPGEYRVALNLTWDGITLDIWDQVSNQPYAQVSLAEDFPVDMAQGPYLGFTTVDGRVMLSELQLLLEVPRGRDLDSANVYFRGGDYRRAAGMYSAQLPGLTEARDIAEAQYRICLCQEQLWPHHPERLVTAYRTLLQQPDLPTDIQWRARRRLALNLLRTEERSALTIGTGLAGADMLLDLIDTNDAQRPLLRATAVDCADRLLVTAYERLISGTPPGVHPPTPGLLGEQLPLPEEPELPRSPSPADEQPGDAYASPALLWHVAQHLLLAAGGAANDQDQPLAYRLRATYFEREEQRALLFPSDGGASIAGPLRDQEEGAVDDEPPTLPEAVNFPDATPWLRLVWEGLPEDDSSEPSGAIDWPVLYLRLLAATTARLQRTGDDALAYCVAVRAVEAMGERLPRHWATQAALRDLASTLLAEANTRDDADATAMLRALIEALSP